MQQLLGEAPLRGCRLEVIFVLRKIFGHRRQLAANLIPGIEHEAIEDARDVVLFEDLGNGQTKLTFIGNDTMQSAIESGQAEGWAEQLDKIAAVVAGLVQTK